MLGMLSACASAPLELPDWDLTPASVDIQRPLRLPELPAVTRASETEACYSPEALAALTRYSVVSGGNYAIAEENAQALEDLSAAYNNLVQAGKNQQVFTQIREQQLIQERRDHFIDNWFHRGLIALGILVSL